MTRAAILEPGGLLGKELRDQLDAQHPELATEITLLTQRDEDVGTLTDVGGAAAMVRSFTLDDLDAVDLLFHCDPRADEIAYLGRLPPNLGVIVVSLSIRIPDGRLMLAEDDDPAARGDVLVSPHPAVVGLAHLLRPLLPLGLEEAVATILVPASIYDQEALEEVFAQTRALLEFKRPAAGKRFSEQLAFNVLPGPSDEPVIVEHLAALLPGVPRLSAHSLQAGVFHGLGLSVFCQLGVGVDPDDVVAAWSGHEQLELAETPESVGPVAAATGQTVLVGEVRPAPKLPGAFWLWAALDNLTRGGAVNAIGIASRLLTRV